MTFPALKIDVLYTILFAIIYNRKGWIKYTKKRVDHDFLVLDSLHSVVEHHGHI